ncbi:MAG: dTMP kinase [Patescibacteria group bacterium]|nr:dTMP kinase [Patescibacteria group bacterium]
MSGKFIVFEGGEGGGKTTQIRLLKYYLEKKGYQIILTREPGGVNCPLAEAIRHILVDPEYKSIDNKTELFLFLAARAQHVKEIIQPAIESGKIVLCDRFDGSTFAYQHFARGLNLDKIKEWNDWAKNYLEPDLVILLDVDPIIGIKRRGKDLNRIDTETMDFHQKVREGYLELSKKLNNWQIVDANQEVENISQDIIKIVDNLLIKK